MFWKDIELSAQNRLWNKTKMFLKNNQSFWRNSETFDWWWQPSNLISTDFLFFKNLSYFNPPLKNCTFPKTILFVPGEVRRSFFLLWPRREKGHHQYSASPEFYILKFWNAFCLAVKASHNTHNPISQRVIDSFGRTW